MFNTRCRESTPLLRSSHPAPKERIPFPPFRFPVFSFRFLTFELVSNFDIRISDFPRPDAQDRPRPPRTTSRPDQTTPGRPAMTAYDHVKPAIQNKGLQRHHPPLPEARPRRRRPPDGPGPVHLDRGIAEAVDPVADPPTGQPGATVRDRRFCGLAPAFPALHLGNNGGQHRLAAARASPKSVVPPARPQLRFPEPPLPLPACGFAVLPDGSARRDGHARAHNVASHSQAAYTGIRNRNR